MFDVTTTVVLALSLLLGSIKIAGGEKPPAGGAPIPQKGAGVGNVH